MLKDINTYSLVNEIKGLSKFTGYCVINSESNRKNQNKAALSLLYEFG